MSDDEDDGGEVRLEDEDSSEGGEEVVARQESLASRLARGDCVDPATGAIFPCGTSLVLPPLVSGTAVGA